jgi:tRNA1Val (adenine37-N6)-methyltransferase
MQPTTTDSALGGTLRVKQHREGYRFSIDAFLLAGFVRPGPEDAVLDLGSGCGIIPLILARRHPGLRIYGVEVQRELALLAKENAQENQMSDRIRILHKDLKELRRHSLASRIDWVVTNPPFRRRASGRVNPDIQRAIARHEIKLTLDDLVRVSATILDPGGRFAVVYPAERLTGLLCTLRKWRIEPKMLRMVHSLRESEAKRVLVEGVKEGRPGVRVCRPLAIYRQDGRYTREAAAMFLP